MREPAFTPGPWLVDVTDEEIRIHSFHPSAVATMSYTDDIALNTARLIAAAPALYEALDALFRSYKELADSGDAGFWSLEDQPEGKQAMAALSLALGESPNA